MNAGLGYELRDLQGEERHADMYAMLISPHAFLFLLLSRSSKGSKGAVFTHQTVHRWNESGYCT
jgi:hypothetical protein